MPTFHDPSVRRCTDGDVEHLIAMFDEDEFETDEELWAGNRSSRGDGVEALQAAPSATFPGHR